MTPRTLLVLASLLLLGACGTTAPKPSAQALRQQVADTERAFAATMARRDAAGFVSFLSEEAVFFSRKGPLHGRQEVADSWKRFFERPDAPFSWEPEQVEVLPTGTLALSSGPVRDPEGKLIGTFTSIWRLEEPGHWRIIFDKGCDVCPERR